MSDVQLPKDTKLAQECVVLGCQRAVAHDLIQELRAENTRLRNRVREIEIANYGHSDEAKS